MPSKVTRNDSKLFPPEIEFAVQPEAPPPRIAPLKPTPVYDTYWWFAAERQRIFFSRLMGQVTPWTDDPVLRASKFTNAYRASDRVSQYLIRRVIYRNDLPDAPAEVVFRILFFKMFNRIETWELLEQRLGPITYTDYSFKQYDKVLNAALARGDAIYSAAYIMPSGGLLGHKRKHRNHLELLARMMEEGLPNRLAQAGTMQRAFDLIRAYPTVGDFLGYQYVTDINYSPVTNFTEMEFVIPGPGAIDGIRKCFHDTGGLNDAEVIRFMADRQEVEFERLGLQFQTLWGRRLQLIDCQNLFCEVNKYARVRHPDISGVSGRTRIKQRFRPRPDRIAYWYPPKWGINTKVAASQAGATAGTTSFLSIGRPEVAMDFNTYQERANKTDRNPGQDEMGMMIPLLGLAGEAGQVLSEYKKYLRDGESHILFKERFAEELGDLLWYLANAASKFGLSLAEVAETNLAKCEGRWGALPDRPPFDTGFPNGQRLPRKFLVDFSTFHDENEVPRVRVMYKGKPFGDELTDNSYVRDGYGYHDALHLSFKLDRITRSLKDFVDLWALFAEHDVDVVSLREKFDTSMPTGEAMVQLIMVFAQLERKMTAERTFSIMRDRAERGLWNGGHILGYQSRKDDPGRLEIDEEGAAIVRRIFDLFEELGSAGAVTRRLNDLGIRYPIYRTRSDKVRGGNRFTKQKVIGILRNTVYIGQICWGDSVKDDCHEPIITRQQFDRVQLQIGKTITRRMNLKKPKGRVYLLSGLLRCQCGAHMVGASAHGRTAKNYYYVCTRQNHEGGKYSCNSSLENAIIGRIAAIGRLVEARDRIVQEALACLGGEADRLREAEDLARADWPRSMPTSAVWSRCSRAWERGDWPASSRNWNGWRRRKNRSRRTWPTSPSGRPRSSGSATTPAPSWTTGRTSATCWSRPRRKSGCSFSSTTSR